MPRNCDFSDPANDMATTQRTPRRKVKAKPLTRIKDLHPDPANRRSHGTRNLGLVVDALRAVGAARSIVIDEDNVVLAGNGVTEAATAAGITKLQVVDVSGDTLVAVRRRGLTPGQKRELAIYDNRSAELAEWNLTQLAADLQNGEDLSAYFLDGELAALRLLGEAVADPQAEWRGMPEFSQDEQSAFHTIHVHFKDAAALQAFGDLIGRAVSKTVRYLWMPEDDRAVFEDKAYS
jgi:hypothetical protein